MMGEGLNLCCRRRWYGGLESRKYCCNGRRSENERDVHANIMDLELESVDVLKSRNLLWLSGLLSTSKS